jgi:hypothetical protein
MSMGFFTFEIISVDITRLIFHFRNHVNEIFHLRNYLGGISRDEIFALRNHFALSLDIQGAYCEIGGSPKYPSSNATELNDFGFRLYMFVTTMNRNIILLGLLVNTIIMGTQPLLWKHSIKKGRRSAFCSVSLFMYRRPLPHTSSSVHCELAGTSESPLPDPRLFTTTY